MANRRVFLRSAGQAGILVALPAATAVHAAEGGKQVSATEDLMREHGVLRRAFLVYQTAALRIDSGKGQVPAPALARTARLFRTFGEDYHERRLEEQIIFPAVRKLKGPVARYPDILHEQHDRGRELTAYVMEVSRGGRLASGSEKPLARALHEFALMYAHHAAREDTDVFPAWKASLPAKAYQEMGEQFERIEQQVFGHDGFEDALKQIEEIEREMGLSDLAALTMPEIPRRGS